MARIALTATAYVGDLVWARVLFPYGPVPWSLKKEIKKYNWVLLHYFG